MVGLNISTGTKGQLAAIARVRWEVFVNSLWTTRGTMELVSRIFVALLVGFAGVGGAIGLGFAAWNFVSQGSPQWLALLLWVVFVFWQLFPVMATAFTESTDSSIFLRFPLSYTAYFLVVVVFGAFDIASTLGTMWLLGVFTGIVSADRGLAVWAAIVLGAFAVTNVVMGRTIFAWIERWLAQRRTREIFGILFFLFMIGVQFVAPVMNHYGKRSQPEVMRVGQQLSPLQRVLPPGLAADAIAHFHSNGLRATASLAALCVYCIAMLWVLRFRLRAQFRGESLSETSAPAAKGTQGKAVRKGWKVPGLSGPTAAMFEKELLYLSRSGPMLFTLIMPVVMLTVFRFGGTGRRNGGLLTNAPNFAFPIGAAYALLVLTNLVYNNFGADGGGIQFLFASPVRPKQVVMAKNLAHALVLAVELLLVWAAGFFLYRPPRIDVTVATLTAILFAVPINFAAGDLLSIYAPKRVEYATFGRQRASQTTILASFVVQICVVGLATIVFLFAPQTEGAYWLAALIFTPLAAIGLAGYFLVLARIDRVVLDRRETLISEMCRT
jgi:ABC-2 type transport system permease protein